MSIKHFESRLLERILNKDSFVIGFEYPKGGYERVGSMCIPDDIKNNIQQKVTIIRNIKFDKDVSYGYRLFEVDSSLVEFDDDETEEWAEGKTLVVIDEDTESNGNLIYAIIRNNSIATICFVKDYTGKNGLESKLRVDELLGEK